MPCLFRAINRSSSSPKRLAKNAGRFQFVSDSEQIETQGLISSFTLEQGNAGYGIIAGEGGFRPRQTWKSSKRPRQTLALAENPGRFGQIAAASAPRFAHVSCGCTAGLPSSPRSGRWIVRSKCHSRSFSIWRPSKVIDIRDLTLIASCAS
ncbi:hypothetical protein VTK56DRAFT_9137 [Thermocarpiscus australiensis]